MFKTIDLHTLSFKRFIPLIFFIVVLFIGCFNAKNHGVSWDELIERSRTVQAAEYVLYDNPAFLEREDDLYHGTIFGFILMVGETIFESIYPTEKLPNKTKTVFILYHFLTFFTFYLGLIAFYFLCKRIFQHKSWALLACTFLVLSPHIFSHAFYNSKDIPFMSFFIISMYTLSKILGKPKIKWIIIHAICNAILIDMRIPGIFIPAITLGFFIYYTLIEPKNHWKRTLVNIFCYLIVLVSCIIAFWPLLWHQPLFHFITAYKTMSHFHHWGGSVLYLGQYIKGNALPWHYLPVWILVSTPILYSVLFIVGFGHSLKSVFTHPIKFIRQHPYDLIMYCWLLPLVLIIASKPVLYDAWRHVFFIYPGIILLSIKGAQKIWSFLQAQHRYFKYLCITIFFGNLMAIGIWMIQENPYQHVFFNRASKLFLKPHQSFELDYWGLGYRQAWEYLLRNDLSPHIRVHVANMPGYTNFTIFIDPETRKRVEIVDSLPKADYFLTNHRGKHTTHYPYPKYYTVQADGVDIITVFNVKDF